MLRPWFKPAAVVVLSLDGIAVRASGADDVRIISNEAHTPEGVLTVLQTHANELGLRRVRFILSNQLARYTVLPWQPGVYAMQDWVALGVHKFRNQFGAVADDWEIRVALQGYGMPAVACALDRHFIERLLDLSAKAGWKVRGIEPALMTVFNQHQGHFMHQTDHWLLFAEPQRILLGQISHGAWQHFYMDSPLAGEESGAGQSLIEHALHMQEGAAPSAIACFGPPALLPKTLPENVALLRLPHPVLGESKVGPHLQNLNMLAEAV